MPNSSHLPALTLAILRAVEYADIFDFPLTLKEIHVRAPIRASLQQISGELSKLLRDKLLTRRSGYYFLPGKDLASLRKRRERVCAKKILLASRAGNILMAIPTISAVFLTGSLAAGNARNRDDIDLMLITKPNSLWTTRLIIIPFFDILNLRRKRLSRHVADKLCFNLFLSETSLSVPEPKRSLYTAHEILLAKPLFDKNNQSSHLLSSNPWIRDYFPNLPPQKKRKLPPTSMPNPLENLAYNLQLLYMRRHQTNEVVSKSFAFFHPQDLSKQLLPELDRRMRKYTRSTR